MRLQSLELHGFKSFPERTKITFDIGMTVIVGPNGSGKSNISDAVKWVLGELSAKNIRGVKLEDVIFGGTDKRSPMGFAEVSLTIDNTGEFRIQSDYNEITVTRRYFRTGESEYYINGQARRLRDIVDLFMNTGIGKTGYSIIGQGKISEIIAQRSEDRRYIFEEAAGISKYRHKKHEAERKLAEVENNLLRVSDIVAVLEQRVG
ncbi:MAG: AAA family ATPase, partial [Clostridia bacterium]|nr:AAA family ATPase [Clostridia bacterium]